MRKTTQNSLNEIHTDLDFSKTYSFLFRVQQNLETYYPLFQFFFWVTWWVWWLTTHLRYLADRQGNSKFRLMKQSHMDYLHSFVHVSSSPDSSQSRSYYWYHVYCYKIWYWISVRESVLLSFLFIYVKWFPNLFKWQCLLTSLNSSSYFEGNHNSFLAHLFFIFLLSILFFMVKYLPIIKINSMKLE